MSLTLIGFVSGANTNETALFDYGFMLLKTLSSVTTCP